MSTLQDSALLVFVDDGESADKVDDILERLLTPTSEHEGGGYTSQVTNMENLFRYKVLEKLTGSESPDIFAITQSNTKVIAEQPAVRTDLHSPPLTDTADVDKDGLIDIFLPHTYEMRNGKSHTVYTHIDNFNVNEDELWIIHGLDYTTNGIVVGHEII